MSKYQVRFYTGDYYNRQLEANNDGATVYLEQHFNASPSTSPNTNYAMSVVASNASEKSKSIARTYIEKIKDVFMIDVFGRDGLKVLSRTERGNHNLRYTAMPAVLLEPLFCSSYDGSYILKSQGGIRQLAFCLVETVKTHYPDGGLIGFSIGHIGKTSAPSDMGALVLGGGTEAQYAELVMVEAARMLEGITDEAPTEHAVCEVNENLSGISQDLERISAEIKKISEAIGVLSRIGAA